MRSLLLAFALLLMLSPMAIAQGVAIARVDYSKIETLLEKVVLSDPANAKLSERFKKQEAKAEKLQKDMQESIMKGEAINPMEAAAAGFMFGSKDREKVELLCEKRLLAVIKKTVGDEYPVVLKTGHVSPVLFTKIPVDDVTDLIRQELLRQLPEK